MAKKTVASKEEPKDRRCSFRAVRLPAKKKVGMGPHTIEHQFPGSTIWNPSVSGLEAGDIESALRFLEGRGCIIEYNEFFQPSKVKKGR